MPSEGPLTSDEVAALYEKYGYFLLRRCRSILRDPGLADDTLQESFVKILRSGAELRTMQQPLRWLYRVVDHCCFDALRKRRRSPETLSPDEGAGRHPGVDLELRDTVLRMLEAFDDDQKQIAVLLFVDGMSQGEIAEEVGVSRITVNKRVQSIRARAEAWLEGHP